MVALTKHLRTCQCGRSQGRYVDDLTAVFHGETAVPLGFNNASFDAALQAQPLDGEGRDFIAFVIPQKCPTFVRSAQPLRSRGTGKA